MGRERPTHVFIISSPASGACPIVRARKVDSWRVSAVHGKPKSTSAVRQAVYPGLVTSLSHKRTVESPFFLLPSLLIPANTETYEDNALEPGLQHTMASNDIF